VQGVQAKARKACEQRSAGGARGGDLSEEGVLGDEGAEALSPDFVRPAQYLRAPVR